MSTLHESGRKVRKLTVLCFVCASMTIAQAQLPVPLPPITVGVLSPAAPPPAAPVQNISVSINPAQATVLVTGQQEFTATVTGDVTNAGITWTVGPASGTSCGGSTCGTVSPATSGSGVAIAYQAPSAVPPGAIITVTATSVADPTKSASAQVSIASATNNSTLSGDYAFSFNGMMQSQNFIFAGVGRLTFDGAGNVINGEVDINSTQYPGPVVVQQVFSGTYAIGADHRGVMSWNVPGTGPSGGSQPFAQLAFALKADGGVVFTVWHPMIGRGEFGSGTMERVDPTAYSTSHIAGDFAFGTGGFDHSNNRAGFAGRLTADGAGNFSNVDAVLNTAGMVYETVLSTGSYAVSEPFSGRGTLRIVAQVGPVPRTFNFAFYVVNNGELFALETDSYAVSTPLLTGRLLQQAPGGGFSNSSLNGGSVVYLAGGSACGGGSSPQSDVFAGLLTFDGAGNLTVSDDRNCGGISTSIVNQPGTYTVYANGHTCIFAGPTELVAYMINPNQAFVLGTDASAFSGMAEAQTVVTATNPAVMGAYTGTTSTIAPFAGNSWSGEFTADGASPTGNFTGAKDVVDAVGPNADVPFSGTYSISSSPTNGRGTMSVSSGAGAGVFYVISTSKFVEIPSNDPNPAVLIFSK